MKVHTSKLKIKCLFRGKKRLKVYTSMSFLTSHMFLSPVCIICDFGPSSPLPVLICGSMEEDVKVRIVYVILCLFLSPSSEPERLHTQSLLGIKIGY
jgi:hypothetical protein